MLYKKILKIIGIVILGALGALIFNIFLMPQMLASLYFDDFQFVKDFKQGRVVVNKTEQVYIREDSAIEGAVERVKKSIIAIRGAKTNIRAGLIVSSDGLAATLASAVPAGNFDVLAEGNPADFKIEKTDSKNNLTLLKINKNNLQALGFADLSKVKLGQKVFFVYPVSEKMDDWRTNEGIIRQISGEKLTTNIDEEKMAAGTPIFNSSGEVVGLGFVDLDGRVSVISVDKIKILLGL